MRRGGAKQKGSEFERKIAKEIVKAFKEFGIEQRECWRSVLSGGHTISSGDLEMSNRLWKLFPYSVECKHRKKVRWENFLLGKKTEERKWIAQAEEGASKHPGLAPLLVIRSNNCPIYALCKTWAIGRKRAYLSYEAPTDEGYVQRWILMRWNHFLKVAVRKARRT